jgi:very-short-patch-repair endonuclease
MTPCEKILWQHLRTNNLAGLRFRRQHPIRFYIADFYCHAARLVIEVDEIRYHLKQVLKKIEEASIMRIANKAIPTSSSGKGSPSPSRGGRGKGHLELISYWHWYNCA